MNLTTLTLACPLLLLAAGGCASSDSASADSASTQKHATVSFGLRGSGSAHDDADDDTDDDAAETETEILLSEVPDRVKAAALEAVPGLVLEEAEREREGDDGEDDGD